MREVNQSLEPLLRNATSLSKRTSTNALVSIWTPASAGSITPPEPFVDAIRAAAFLSIRPRRILELAREGAIPAHPIGKGPRKVWRFRLSELAAAIEARNNNTSSRPCSRNEEAAW